MLKQNALVFHVNARARNNHLQYLLVSEVVHSNGVSVVRVVGLPDEIHELPQMRYAPAGADTNAVACAHTRTQNIFTHKPSSVYNKGYPFLAKNSESRQGKTR